MAKFETRKDTITTFRRENLPLLRSFKMILYSIYGAFQMKYEYKKCGEKRKKEKENGKERFSTMQRVFMVANALLNGSIDLQVSKP